MEEATHRIMEFIKGDAISKFYRGGVCLAPTIVRNKSSQTKENIFRCQVQHRHTLDSLTVEYIEGINLVDST